MQKYVCDICGIDEPKHNWKIKEKRLYLGRDEAPPLLRWDRMDICDKCFENLVKLRYEKDLEKRVANFAIDRYEKLYPKDADLQTAYLTGAQDIIDILLQNKVVKQRKK